MNKNDWIFTKKRRDSIKKAANIHREMVELGKKEYYKTHKKPI